MLAEARGFNFQVFQTLQNALPSRLDLRSAIFERCTLAETSFFGSMLTPTRWARCRGRQADFGAADLVDAKFQSSDVNNASWRRANPASVDFKGCKLWRKFRGLLHTRLPVSRNVRRKLACRRGGPPCAGIIRGFAWASENFWGGCSRGQWPAQAMFNDFAKSPNRREGQLGRRLSSTRSPR